MGLNLDIAYLVWWDIFPILVWWSIKHIFFLFRTTQQQRRGLVQLDPGPSSQEEEEGRRGGFRLGTRKNLPSQEEEGKSGWRRNPPDRYGHLRQCWRVSPVRLRYWQNPSDPTEDRRARLSSSLYLFFFIVVFIFIHVCFLLTLL